MGLSNYIPSSRISQSGVCTSTTRPASPYEGQMIYETDTNRVLVYDNSAWVMIADTDQPPAMQIINTTSWTSQTSINVDSVFSSDYKNYHVVANVTGSGVAQNISLIFRSGSPAADTGAGNYNYQGQFLDIPTNGWNNANRSQAGNDFPEFGRVNGTEEASFTFDVFGPNTSNITTFRSTVTDARVFRVSGGWLNATTAVTGFRIFSANATSGTVRVYGLRNS